VTSKDTPGPLGAGILAILFGIIVFFVVMAVRRRRHAHV